MKYKIQINGESLTGLTDEQVKQQGGMNDPEFEFTIESDSDTFKDMKEFLDYLVASDDETIFNYYIYE